MWDCSLVLDLLDGQGLEQSTIIKLLRKILWIVIFKLVKYIKRIVPHVNAHQLGTSTEEALNNTVDKRIHSVDCQPFPSAFPYPDKWAHKKVTMTVEMGFVNGLDNINIQSPKLT